MTVRDLFDRIDIRNIGVRIAERLNEDCLRIFFDCAFHCFQIVNIHK